MNNKGFAASGILYTILLIFLAIMMMAIFNFESKKHILDQLKSDVAGEFVDNEDNNVYKDNSGAPYPELYQGMIPVKYDSNGNTVVADLNEEWYNYDNHEWANAVLVTSSARNKSAGETLSQSEILQYYVWIPRYKYKLWNTQNGTSNEQMIDIEFEKKSTSKSTGSTNNTWLTHPAFTFGNTELNGLWVGKFEMTGGVSTSSNPTNLTIKPNQVSLVNISIGNSFNAVRSLDITYSSSYGLDTNEIDTHMMKNMEWGAVAYLTNSKYGRYINSNTCVSSGCEVWINNVWHGNYTNGTITGCSSISTSIDSARINMNNCGGTQYEWNGTTNNGRSSTTGNIYGLYDMVGGAWEWIMGNVSSNATSYVYYQKDSGLSQPLDKYYDKYINTDTTNPNGSDSGNTNYNGGLLGDATREIIKTTGTTRGGWYGDISGFANDPYPWFIRGGYASRVDNTGIFAFSATAGAAHTGCSMRAVLSEQDGNYNGNGLE